MNMEIIQQDTTSKQLIITNREASINSLEIANLVDRWYELEKQQNVGALPDFSNPAEAARAWAEHQIKESEV